MDEPSLRYVHENIRLIDEEIRRTQLALVALYKHREAAVRPLVDLARLAPVPAIVVPRDSHMVDPLKRTVGGPQAPCLSGDLGWTCDGCRCWKYQENMRLGAHLD